MHHMSSECEIQAVCEDAVLSEDRVCVHWDEVNETCHQQYDEELWEIEGECTT